MRPPATEETTDLPDLTPMIDVVFLLIVFFMTVAQMQVQERVPGEIPVAEAAVVPEERGERVTVSMKEDGSVFVGAMPVGVDALSGHLAPLKAAQPALRVYLRADASVPYRDVRTVFEAITAAGVADVVFASYQSDK